MKRLTALLTIVAIALSTAACNKKKEAGAPGGRVSATPAFERYFGTAPTTNKGSCFAFVIFFPSADRGRLVPFPFFTFDQPSIKKVAVERLLGGMDLPAYRGEFRNPFPAGTRLLALSEKEGSLSLEMSNSGSGDAAQRTAGRNALYLTLAQFPGVKEIRVVSDGTSLKLKAPGETAVKEPGPPRLLSVTGTKERGAAAVDDVSVLFDRPLEIRELQLTGNDGQSFPGDMYHSVFDMAAVLKPKNPQQFRAGMPLKVRWKVMDRKGREGGGESALALQIVEH